jgi:hypothetical protein
MPQQRALGPGPNPATSGLLSVLLFAAGLFVHQLAGLAVDAYFGECARPFRLKVPTHFGPKCPVVWEQRVQPRVEVSERRRNGVS